MEPQEAVPSNTLNPKSHPQMVEQGSEVAVVSENVAGASDRKARRKREKRKQLRAFKAEDRLRQQCLQIEEIE